MQAKGSFAQLIAISGVLLVVSEAIHVAVDQHRRASLMASACASALDLAHIHDEAPAPFGPSQPAIAAMPASGGRFDVSTVAVPARWSAPRTG